MKAVITLSSNNQEDGELSDTTLAELPYVRNHHSRIEVLEIIDGKIKVERIGLVELFSSYAPHNHGLSVTIMLNGAQLFTAVASAALPTVFMVTIADEYFLSVFVEKPRSLSSDTVSNDFGRSEVC